MKKQLLIAAVTATMASASMADVFISGSYSSTISHMKVNTKDATKGIKHDSDLDLTLKGTNGDSTMVLTLENIGAGKNPMKDKNGNDIKDASGNIVYDGSGTGSKTDIKPATVYITTKVEGLTLKAGKYKSKNGAGQMHKPMSKNRISLSTKIAGVNIGVSNANGDAHTSLNLAGTVAGVDIKVQNVLNAKRYLTLGAEFYGVSIDFEAGKATNPITKKEKASFATQLSGEVYGVSIVYANIKSNGTATENRDTARWGDITRVDSTNGLSLTYPTPYGKINYKFVGNKRDSVKMNTNSFSLIRGNVEYKTAKTSLSGISGATDAERVTSVKVKFKF